MKIHTRFFITFFCFALFFAFSSYLAQDSIFKYNQAREDLRVNTQLDTVRSNLRLDSTFNFDDYFTFNQIDMKRVFFNEYTNQVEVQQLSTLNVELSNNIVERFHTQEQIQATCTLLSNLEDQVRISTPTVVAADYIIQEFCVNDALYVMTSSYIHFGNAINLLMQSYLFIAIGTIVVSAILSYILARYISTPLQKISYVTQKISNLDFSNRVEVIGNDEIGDLAVNINILSDKLQNAINKLKESVILEKESREKQNQLFASMSHELKTPLTILHGTLEGIKDQIGPYKNPLDHVDGMMEEVEGMQDLVLSLINYAKYSVSDRKIDLKPYSIQKIIYEQINKLDYLINENNIDLEMFITDANVDIDYPSMCMVFKNVFENAIRYSDKGAKIEVFTSTFTDYVLVQVYNHGVNIDPERLMHLFEPFYRADDSRIKYKQGTGLGLTIVKQILEQNKSTPHIYNVNNDDEYAVCFEFTLPRSKVIETTN